MKPPCEHIDAITRISYQIGEFATERNASSFSPRLSVDALEGWPRGDAQVDVERGFPLLLE